MLQNLSLACERAEDENQRMLQAKYGSNPPKMYHEVKFNPREHFRLWELHPFVKQIVTDMHEHAKHTNPATASMAGNAKE